jgi:hypothetical protein
MPTEKLVEGLAKQLDRRTFLAKLGAGTVGVLLALMGFPQRAAAYDYACCHLCNAPSSCSGCASCSGNQCGKGTCGSNCSWCWDCCDANRHMYRCCECYSSPPSCCGGCPATSSCVTYLGFQQQCGGQPVP